MVDATFPHPLPILFCKSLFSRDCGDGSGASVLCFCNLHQKNHPFQKGYWPPSELRAAKDAAAGCDCGERPAVDCALGLALSRSSMDSLRQKRETICKVLEWKRTLFSLRGAGGGLWVNVAGGEAGVCSE